MKKLRIVQEDTFRHKGLRQKLINQLKEDGITSTAVLEAMNAIPRHFFIDSALDNIAYENRAFPIAADQTISHPYTVAYQTQLLNIKRMDKVLEVGTGSGYQACVLAQLGARVYSIERQRELYNKIQEFDFVKKYPNLKIFLGDGFAGKATFGPFDKIIITCGAPFIPPKLMEQMKVGGIMVVPVDEEGKQRMIKVTKENEGKYIEEKLDVFSFVPMLEGISK
jgi:protein-L-isoaspartate(D-aspartate) O-methyltransferase